MTKAVKTKAAASTNAVAGSATAPKGMGPPKKHELRLHTVEGEARGRTLARTMIGPLARHAALSSTYAGGAFTDDADLSITEIAALLEEELANTADGDTTMISRMLAAQAVSTDTIFTEMASRAAKNMGQYLDATERYMQLALNAQAASRANLEALARLHQPREQTVRHVHVEHGGQAVVADQFHHHAGGADEKAVEQSHATVTAG